MNPGSLILGAAGLLKGRRAACHWAWADLLALFGAELAMREARPAGSAGPPKRQARHLP